MSISIHAPLAGCDATVCIYQHSWAEFQSTHPLRGATTVGAQAVFTDGFQSTHPLRGATRPTRVMLPFVRRNFNPRTPCGVRRRLYNNPWAVFKFQSTHPLRGATAGSDARPGTVDISIHASLAGCDSVDQRHGLGAAISIHAPLAGCDTVSILFMPRVTYFNPRTPCGVRRLYPHADCAGRDFNPRTPCGVRPQARKWYNWLIEFQSTHPLRGATGITHKSGEHIKHFNPRTPCGVRHNSGSRPARRGNFNPRTPCGVRLCAPSVRLPVRSYFNPRTPCGVRHVGFQQQPGHVTISIHAPLAGCDSHPAMTHASYSGFQSTHPLRGATSAATALVPLLLFQSTHPLRGATSGRAALYPAACISIHAPLAGCDLTDKK